ncbi:MAG TPA: hypothetical protein VN704_05500 [Verrucomicrobiae bacterium]|nr:hypothetical protein [Verrucomicrobiae bacterium]
MSTETQNAVLDWELKLNNENSGNNPWDVSIVEISSSVANSYNKTSCDVIMSFLAEPSNPNEQFIEAGKEWIDEDGKSYIDIYYLAVVEKREIRIVSDGSN